MQPINYQNLRPAPKISLNHQTKPNKKDLSIDKDLINAAINRSYLKKMVGSDTLEAEEVVNTVANFVFSFLTPPNIEKEL